MTTLRAWLLAAGVLASGAVSATSIADLYGERCARCHAAGDVGAPKVGDRAEWTRRIRPGMTLLYRSAIEGIPNTQMSAKGGNPELSDAEVRALVDYMLAASALAPEALKAAQRYDALRISNREFIRLDRNFDGRLSRDELAADPALVANMSRFDENRDGMLSVPEYEKLEATLEQERAAVTVDDTTLITAVRAALARMTTLSVDSIKVEAADGVVTLTGIVSDAEVARQAYQAVRRIRGIKKIDDRLISAHLFTFD